MSENRHEQWWFFYLVAMLLLISTVAGPLSVGHAPPRQESPPSTPINKQYVRIKFLNFAILSMKSQRRFRKSRKVVNEQCGNKTLTSILGINYNQDTHKSLNIHIKRHLF